MPGRRLAIWLLALLGATGASASAIDDAGAQSGADPDAWRPKITHLATETIAESGRSRVIHFAVDPPPTEDRTHPATVSDPTVLEVIRAPSVLSGWTLGTVRVRGLRCGEATLSVGDAALRVRVIDARGAVAATVSAPRIVGPAPGAAVWGRIAVGVEVRERPSRPLRHVMVYAGNALALMPAEDTGTSTPPFRQLRYTLDVSALPPGPIELRAVATDENEDEQSGPPVTVRVVHPSDDRIQSGEAEWRYEIEQKGRFGSGQVAIAEDDAASGGMYADNASPYPPVAFPVTVRHPGWYQMMLVARGTRAKGALPLVAVMVDDYGDPSTNGRLLSETWHRVAIGIPFPLATGRHTLAPLFGNDIMIPGIADRNLHIDRIEIGRVGYAVAPEVEREPEDPFGMAAVPLRIGFVRPIHGTSAAGTLEIEGRVWRTGTGQEPPPVVTLMINGRSLQPQRSIAPRFRIDPSFFTAGANRVQLVARSEQGPVAVTPVQVVRWEPGDAPPPGATPPPPPPARRHLRYTVHDERWQPDMPDLLRDHDEPSEGRAAAFFSRRAVALTLPADLAGNFDVLVETRGARDGPPAVLSVSLFDKNGMNEIGRLDVPGDWSTREAATVTLPAGRKRLVVRCEDETGDDESDEPRVLLRALLLAEKPQAADLAPPTVSLRYPAAGQTMYMADAVVADARDDVSVQRAELLFDGAPTGQTADLSLRPGRVVFPLLLRSITPGPHEVSIQVIDEAGNTTVSEARTVEVLDAAPEHPGPYDRAVRLLNRFAYGPDPASLASILIAGEDAWLDDALSRPFDEPGEMAALGAGLARFPGLDPNAVTGRVLTHLLLTPNPARAKFVLWVENHFSTWVRKVGGETKWFEHEAYTRLGFSPFDRLLFASAESPAMLAYLDQAESYAGKLNENYAREIMELHTLGVDGGYVQSDVTNLAHLLTGWTASLDGDGRSSGAAARRHTFRFDPSLNDGDGMPMFGVDFLDADTASRFDRAVLAIQHLASHPSTARFIARKLAEHYVAAPAPDEVVDELAAVFLGNGGDMALMLKTIAHHRDFAEAAATPERIAQPLDFVVRLFRVTGEDDSQRAGAFLRTSGQGLFERPTPDGYPEEGAAYVDSNALIQRWKLALETAAPIAALVPPSWQAADGPLPADTWEQSVVDVIAVRLIGRVLSETSNRAALDVFAAATGTREERVRVIAPFITQLPELNLR